jgi:PAS domain S-box-containing protein
MRVLIVDDIATNRKLLRVTLEAAGHTTLEAPDGVEALQILARETVDALVSDILMPRMDGYRLCHEIRTDRRLRDLPIVIYTATYVSSSDQKLAADMGADKFVRKPASAIKILTALQESAAMQHRVSQPDALGQVEVLKEYSNRLVSKLEEKNIELEERLRLTSLSMDVTTALMHGNALRESLQECCEALVRHLDAAFARVWTRKERENVLELQASAGTVADGHESSAAGCEFKIDRIAADRKPHTTNSVIGDPYVLEDWARRLGLVAFAGYPLIVDDRLIGVLGVSARTSFSAAAFEKIASIADSVALGIGRKLAEQELATTHDRLHRLLELSPAVIYNLTIQGHNVSSTFVSDNIQRVTGVDAASVSYEWWLSIIHPEDRERMRSIQPNGFSEGGYTAEYRVRHQDGTHRWILDNNRVVLNGAGEPEVMGVWTDVTEHRQQRELTRQLEDKAADAEASNRAKSAFLSTMSHEIRTPMNAILGHARLMLRDSSLGPTAKKNLEIIGRSGDHLLRLINDILDMAKIEAGHIELNLTTFHLSSVLEDLAAMFRLRAEVKALRFEMTVEGQVVPYVIADEGKIRQVLINLLGNAIKFTQHGFIRLRVALDQRGGGQLWLRARVEDSGSGIFEEEQNKLFQPFGQTRLGLAAQEGTGLGLSISRGFARLMGGEITFTSQPGVGSAFRFEIPIERGGVAAAARNVPRSVIGIRGETMAPKVLVVDDQPENRGWLAELLTCIGFSVREAENGQTAIRDWKEWNPGLILMDLQMPVMDGLEATRRIKSDPRGKETAILALTASAMDADRQTVLLSGADDFLAKPCHEAELLDKIRMLLNISYDYEEISDTGANSFSGEKTATAESLGKFPLELIHQLQKAIVVGNKKLLDNLIDRVRETEDAGSARGLQALADSYEYDTLTRLLEEAGRR